MLSRSIDTSFLLQRGLANDVLSLRRYLRASLTQDGWKVDMVGTQKSGNMEDNVSS